MNLRASEKSSPPVIMPLMVKILVEPDESVAYKFLHRKGYKWRSGDSLKETPDLKAKFILLSDKAITYCSILCPMCDNDLCSHRNLLPITLIDFIKNYDKPKTHRTRPTTG